MVSLKCLSPESQLDLMIMTNSGILIKLPLEQVSTLKRATQGVRLINLKGYQKEEIRSAFKEFQKYHCKYSDCNHLEEPDCGVKEALAIGEIRQSRYESYRQLLKEGE